MHQRQAIHSSARQSNGSDYSLAPRCMHADGKKKFPLARQLQSQRALISLACNKKPFQNLHASKQRRITSYFITFVCLIMLSTPSI
jgi:hypothetical protein